MEYILNSVIGHCCPLQSRSFLGLDNGSSTTWTNFETTCRMVCDFLNFKNILTIRHPFSETRRNNKGLNEASNKSGGATAIFLAAKNCSTETAVCTMHSHCKSPSPGSTKILGIFGRIAHNVQPDLLHYLWMWRGWALSNETTAVCCMFHNSKPRFHHMHFQCNCPMTVPKLNTNALFLQAAITKLHFICTKTNYSLRGNRDDYSWKIHYTDS
jgi:hypothetical protein